MRLCEASRAKHPLLCCVHAMSPKLPHLGHSPDCCLAQRDVAVVFVAVSGHQERLSLVMDMGVWQDLTDRAKAAVKQADAQVNGLKAQVCESVTW